MIRQFFICPASLKNNFFERFGIYEAEKNKLDKSFDRSRFTVWIHAVSVGETRAVAPLINKLLREKENLRIILTHMTNSGFAMGQELFGIYNDRVISCYLPYDIDYCLRRFFNFFRPDIGLLMETEVWPILTFTAKSCKVPLFLINARLSEKSFRRIQYLGYFGRVIYQNLDMCFAQSKADALRFQQLGLPNVRVLGNLKFDVVPSKTLFNQGLNWRRAFGARHVWLAASTRQGEESLILDAHRQILLKWPDALLLLVPRHTERCERVVSQSAEIFKTIKRSDFPSEDNTFLLSWNLPLDITVCVGDTMGEIVAYASASDLVFVGGSLVATGGQNLIECCSVGKVVIFGPSMFNFQQVSTDALASNAAVQVKNASDLVKMVHLLFLDKQKRLEMGWAALKYAQKYSGATKRTFDLLVDELDKKYN